jgi:diguanylate cyclase (GGDEF)-like protein
MSIKNKIAIRVSLALVLATFVTIAIVAINIRLLNIQHTKDKANIIAEVTKDALTAHMVNGIMDKRDLFLSNIAHLRNVQSLRVIRSQSVNSQFGAARESEKPIDEVDKNVLLTGRPYQSVSEDFLSANLRITVPYIANTVGNPNCLECHKAKDGDVLGAISMTFDLAEAKDYGISTIFKIAFVSFITLLGVMYMLRLFLRPYLDLFTNLTEKIKLANQGDFSSKIETNLHDEAGMAAKQFNSFMHKLQSTFEKIEHNIRTFIPGQHTKVTDPIVQLEGVVNDLADMYKFKRTIENDVSKSEVFNRISTLLVKKFGVKEFAFYEVDADKNVFDRVIVCEGDNECTIGSNCAPMLEQNALLCRANRIGKQIASDDFDRVCPSFMRDGYEHICLPVNIGGKVGMVINIVARNIEELETIKEKAPSIQNYINEAASVIESKKLTEKLRESSLRDALTGLYNRRFLEEYLVSLIPQITRNKKKIAILMIDMDHFKMVNDTYGHDVGDSVLKRLSATLVDNIRESDVVFRYGGEEFIIILNDITDTDAVMRTAEKLRDRVSQMSIKAGKETLKKTISIGVAIFPDDAEQIWKCIKFADTALYEAKGSGRNKVVRFTLELWNESNNDSY